MTSSSPLQIRRHFFTRFSVIPNATGTADGAHTLEPAIWFQKRAEEPNQWALSLAVALKSATPEQPNLYEADIEMFGVVEVLDGFPQEKAEQLAVVNGLSLLYSAIREMFLTITARSARGALALPVLSFVDVLANPSGPQQPQLTQSEPPQPPSPVSSPAQ